MLSGINLLIQHMLELDVQCYAGTFSITWLLMATDCADGADCFKQCSESAKQMQMEMVEDKLLFNARRFKCIAHPDATIEVESATYQPGPMSAIQGRRSSMQCHCFAKLEISEIIDAFDLRAKWKKRFGLPKADRGGIKADRPPLAQGCLMKNVQEHLKASFENLQTVKIESGNPAETRNKCTKFKEQNTRLPGFEEAYETRAHLPETQKEVERARSNFYQCKKKTKSSKGDIKAPSSKRNRCDDPGEHKGRDNIAGVCQSQQQPSSCQVQQPPPQQDFCSPSEQRPTRSLPDLNFLYKFDVDLDSLLPEDDTTED
jgi:hypothetical protein